MAIDPPTKNGTNGNHSKKTTICVFCGSSDGSSESHITAAKSLAHVFHKHDINLVFGGGTTGLMGALASTLTTLSGPSAVHGVIPSALIESEEGITSTKEGKDIIDEFGTRTIVPDMHSRKQMMVDEVVAGGPGSGFIALSGGYGTLEELMEITTWSQLGIHEVGVCVFNVEGFYDGLIDWIKKVVGEGFVGEKHKDIILEAGTAEEAVERLGRYRGGGKGGKKEA